VRDHNEDAHYLDSEIGLFLVCDGMGGHAAGEVASAIAIQTIREQWEGVATMHLINHWLDSGDPDARKRLIAAIRGGVSAAHTAIVTAAATDDAKSGMGTTLVGAMIVGNEAVFAHAGDSRAYLVRDAIAMQLTEDHTLLARLLAAGIDVDVSGEGSRFRSMLTNALGIGQECKVGSFVVPLADGDRFLLCSDGISEYVKEAEIGEVLTKQPSPARAAGRLIELALDRGGGDNATAIVIRVLEAGESPQPVELRRRDDIVIESCAIWSDRMTPQQRLRALRIAIPRDIAAGDRLPAHTMEDRVAWIIVEGTLVQEDNLVEPGAFVYPESLVREGPGPDRDALAVATTDVRALAFRADDFRELCDEDNDLGEALLGAIAPLLSQKTLRLTGRGQTAADPDAESRARLAELDTAPKEKLEPELDLDEVMTTQLQAMPVPASIERAVERSIVPGSLVASPLSRPMVPPVVMKVPPPTKPPISHVFRTPDAPLGERPKADPKAVSIPPPRITPPAGFVSQPSPVQPKKRPPTEPEIEAYIELDAEPASAEELDPSPEHDTVTLSHDEGDARITETITDNSSQTLMLTVTESVPHPRTLTPEISLQVSGTIEDDDEVVTMDADEPPDPDSIVTIKASAPPETRPIVVDEDDEPEMEVVTDPEPEPLRRPKRVSEGWDD
jgi:serine/threonine protein phosphatase PrpC/CRP-like cAMP-binding protein